MQTELKEGQTVIYKGKVLKIHSFSVTPGMVNLRKYRKDGKLDGRDRGYYVSASAITPAYENMMPKPKRGRKPGSGRKLSDLSSLASLPFRITELKIQPGTNVGMALRQARKSLGISASAIARSMDYNVCNINHFELGTGTSGGKYLTETGLKYAKAIGIKKISFII